MTRLCGSVVNDVSSGRDLNLSFGFFNVNPCVCAGFSFMVSKPGELSIWKIALRFEFVCLLMHEPGVHKQPVRDVFLPFPGLAQAPLRPWKWEGGYGKWINAACFCCTVSMNRSGLLLFLFVLYSWCSPTFQTCINAHSSYTTYSDSVNNSNMQTCLYNGLHFLCLTVWFDYQTTHQRPLPLSCLLCAQLCTYLEARLPRMLIFEAL